MSFYNICAQYDEECLKEQLASKTETDVKRTLAQEQISPEGFLTLLSPAAVPFIEDMAQKAHKLTLQHFGRTITLFTPLYLANYCTNRCVYCGFNTKNKIYRSQLSFEQVESEAKVIASTGMKNILILTGDARAKSSPEYIKACVEILNKYFPSVSIEIYAMTEQEYASLVESGVDGMTMFQETYNEKLYPVLHPSGPKHDYRFRLDAPERSCKAGMRVVNIGALLGLDEWRHDAFKTGLHAHYLQSKYPGVDIAVSLPRMRTHVGHFEQTCVVSDTDMVQNLLALRIFIPRAGITISTREKAEFRNNIMHLGVTKMSAGVSTEVGGHAKAEDDSDKSAQFDISDTRSLTEMCEAISSQGYQPVFKDWEPIFGTL
jgi:2-iminoacetate synthase